MPTLKGSRKPSKPRSSYEYRCRRADIEDSEIVELILGMHETIFGNSAPVPGMAGAWWICYHHDEPVGFAGMIPSDQGSNNGYLSRFGVLPGHRGLGLQRRLTGVVERHARKIGLGWLVTDTNRNPPSANSLIKCGYQTYNPAKPWSFSSAVYWRKKISNSKADVPN